MGREPLVIVGRQRLEQMILLGGVLCGCSRGKPALPG